eukprot:6206831-Pleurochrysis_carterae.AAC.1
MGCARHLACASRPLDEGPQSAPRRAWTLLSDAVKKLAAKLDDARERLKQLPHTACRPLLSIKQPSASTRVPVRACGHLCRCALGLLRARALVAVAQDGACARVIFCACARASTPWFAMKPCSSMERPPTTE